MTVGAARTVLPANLQELADSFHNAPAIFRRGETDDDDSPDFGVPGWPGDPTYSKPSASAGNSGDENGDGGKKTSEAGIRQSVHKVARQKGVSSGRTYTSKYRGVHQTFPTRRWEAQFRRNGKPTSLGCFDHEEEAARAYDRMMVWCELHGQDSRGSAKHADRGNNVSKALTAVNLNFDYGEYEPDFDRLQNISQDDLVQNLRRQGRLQAANQNKDGVGGQPGPSGGDEKSPTKEPVASPKK
jgi:AP2-like factor (euAP2 lineage)|tara:strand:+ start:3758 stop:4483 length:726 start_codon:yes stop_codon:yes gene_type:complete